MLRYSAVKELKYVMLYPPEGDSPILEVCDGDDRDLLCVEVSECGELKFTFYSQNVVTITEPQLQEIIQKAKKNILAVS